jgi:hypothetical protein
MPVTARQGTGFESWTCHGTHWGAPDQAAAVSAEATTHHHRGVQGIL